MSRILFFLALICIIIISFSLYSYNGSPIMNSDNAVSVLVTYDYNWPQDLYFWGQDRGGTFVALFAQIFFRMFGFSPVTSASIAYYTLLIAGFAGFSRLLKTNFSKLLFAIVWFLPPLKFIDLDSSPIITQYSLIGFSIFLFSKTGHEKSHNFSLRNHLLLFSISILLIISVWVSDTAIVTIIILMSMFLLFDRKKIRIRKEIIFYLLFGSLGGILFIHYARAHADHKTIEYLSLNNAREIGSSLTNLKDSLIDAMHFRHGEFFMSIYSMLVVLFFLVIFFLLTKKKFAIAGDSKKWLLFFLLDGLAVLGICVVSKWVFVNGNASRYFFGCYISFSLFFLVLVDQLSPDRKLFTTMQWFIFVIAIAGAVSSPYFLKYHWPKTLRSQIDTFSEFKRLGKIGIIAEYWHAYIVSAADPATIKATPHDHETVRNYALVDSVFAQQNIYVIRYDWMNSFPDTLKQFGHVLLKDGEEFKIAGCDVNKYRKLN